MHHTAPRPSIRRRICAMIAAGVLPLGFAACGSDDPTAQAAAPATTERASATTEPAPATTEPTPAPTETALAAPEPTSTATEATPATGASDLAAYCTDVVVLDQMFQNLDAEDPPAFEAALAEAAPVLERIVVTAPASLADEYAVLATAFGEVVDTGNPEAYFTPAVGAAGEATHAHDVTHCEWDVAEIAMEDFHFTGTFPSEPGQVSFEVTNTGAEAHALIVARKLDEVEGSALDAFNALESEEAFPTAFEPAASVFAEPGGSAHGLADLQPGEYIVFCPIPTGTAGEHSVGDGPPHFTQGMVTSFEVPAT